PYIEQEELYKQFKLDEPWDSPHNKKLLAKMPKVYAAPGQPKGHVTHYRAFTGPGTMFEGRKGVGIRDVPDGTSNTIFVVEAKQAVPWTRPDAFPYDPKKPLPALGGLFEKGFHIALVDGSVRFVSDRVKEKVVRAMITRNGGEVIDTNELDGK